MLSVGERGERTNDDGEKIKTTACYKKKSRFVFLISKSN